MQSPCESPKKMSGIECHDNDDTAAAGAYDDNSVGASDTVTSGDEEALLMEEYEKRPPWKFSWSKPRLKKTTGMSETMKELLQHEPFLSVPPITSPPRSPTKKKTMVIIDSRHRKKK